MTELPGEIPRKITDDPYGAAILIRRLVAEQGPAYWRRYLLAFALMAVAAATTAGSAYLLGEVINKAYVDKDVRGIAEYAAARRAPGSPALDIIVEGVIEGNDPSAIAAKVRPMAEAGATWWIEAMWSAIDGMATPDGQAAVLARLRLGPPRS